MIDIPFLLFASAISLLLIISIIDLKFKEVHTWLLSLFVIICQFALGFSGSPFLFPLFIFGAAWIFGKIMEKKKIWHPADSMIMIGHSALAFACLEPLYAFALLIIQAPIGIFYSIAYRKLQGGEVPFIPTFLLTWVIFSIII